MREPAFADLIVCPGSYKAADRDGDVVCPDCGQLQLPLAVPGPAQVLLHYVPNVWADHA